MASPVTFRLKPETRERLARIARRKRTTTSQVIREAVEAWVEKEDAAGSMYESIKDLIGVIHGGDPHRSENAGRKLTEMLKARRARS